MKIVSVDEMRGIDRRATEIFGISSLILMENAGIRVADAAMNLIQAAHPMVAIVAGKGNNGGDGLVAARHLMNAGIQVEVFVSGDQIDMTRDCAANYQILENMKAPIYHLQDQGSLDRFSWAAANADLIIDALFGISYRPPLRDLDAQVVSIINEHRRPVLAIDIPSGVEADSGRISGGAIQADWTVTLALPKMGLFIEPGRSRAGKVTVADISIPGSLLSDKAIKNNLLTESMMNQHFRPRPAESHKGNYGHVVVIGGSMGMTGAVMLTSAAALSAGAGLVTAAIPESLEPVVAAGLMEVMTMPLPETRDKAVGIEALPVIENLLGIASVCAIGPGLSRYPEAAAIIRFVLERSGIPIVIDADGLNALGQDIGVLGKRQVPIVLTPHPGEMARMLGTSIEHVQSNRLEAAKRAAGEWGVTIVLKGSRTIIAEPGGETYINTTGNPGMATAGSGDVLTGIISSLIGQGLRPHIAAAAGAYLHGKAGDAVRECRGERGMVAGDLVRALPEVIKTLEDQNK